MMPTSLTDALLRGSASTPVAMARPMPPGGASAPSFALVLHGSPLGFRNVVRGANGAVYDIVF
jgi:hypothetical protein